MCADLQVFIDSRYKLAYNGRYTTDEEITGMLIAVLFAGQHTSSVTCTWTLLSMLANQVRGSTLQSAAPHGAQQLPYALPTTLLWATSATNCMCAVLIWQLLSELARMS
jgi:cytochrome P450